MSYAAFLGSRVEVHYRASDLHLSAVGELLSDSRKAIVLGERFHQNGKDKVLRIEIPYQYIIRVIKADAPTSMRTRSELSSK